MSGDPCPSARRRRTPKPQVISTNTTDRSAYFRQYHRERRALLRELWLAQDTRVCEASDCDVPLRERRRGTRYCSNPCWQRERYRRRRARPSP